MLGVQEVSRQARAILKHPDRTTTWVVVAAVTIARSAPRDVLDPGRIASSVMKVNAAFPIIGSRLDHDRWVAGAPPAVEVVPGDPISWPELTAAFALGEQAPLRVFIGPDIGRLVVAGHHAAFDGLGLVKVLQTLVSGRLPEPSAGGTGRRQSSAGGWMHAVRHVLRPADVVARSDVDSPEEWFGARSVDLSGPQVTAALAAACVSAAGDRNHARDQRWRRVGLSLGLGQADGIGNTATYRRVDLSAGDNVRAAVLEALGESREPFELLRSPAWLQLVRPLAGRLSDTVLVSNIGRHAISGASQLEFYPVARGRSAVAFGAAGLDGGVSTVSLRTLHLSRADAELLLADIVRRLSR